MASNVVTLNAGEEGYWQAARPAIFEICVALGYGATKTEWIFVDLKGRGVGLKYVQSFDYDAVPENCREAVGNISRDLRAAYCGLTSEWFAYFVQLEGDLYDALHARPRFAVVMD